MIIMNRIREFINSSGIEQPHWKEGDQKKYKLDYEDGKFIKSVYYSFDKLENRWKFVTDDQVLDEIIKVFPKEEILELYINA